MKISNLTILSTMAAFSAVLLILALSAPLGFADGYHFLSFFCHQIEDRSFQTAGHAWGLCARCIGIYGGVFLLYLVLITNDRHQLYQQVFYLSLASLAILLVEKAFYIAAGMDTGNITRTLIGMGLGMSFAGSLYWLLQKDAHAAQ